MFRFWLREKLIIKKIWLVGLIVNSGIHSHTNALLRDGDRNVVKEVQQFLQR